MTSKTNFKLALLGVAGAGLVAIGLLGAMTFGGDDSDSQAGPGASTLAESAEAAQRYIAGADRICASFTPAPLQQTSDPREPPRGR